MVMIESINNEKIKKYAKLLQKKYRDEFNLYLVSTPHLVNEALKCNLVVEIFLLENEPNTYGEVTFVTENVMRKLTNLTSIPKVVAVVKKQEYREITGNILLLDSIQDPGNLGTIIRSAVAFDINTIILGNGTVDLYNEKVLRAAEGLHFRINFRSENLNSVIPNLKKEGFKIIGTKLTNGTELKEYKFPKKFALVMGNEGAGVDKNTLDLCDEFVYINMNNACESLNVGVATSIILYSFKNANKS